MSGFWQEADEDPTRPISDAVRDLVFRIDCRALPVDHAFELNQALTARLPWLQDEPLAGIHLIHGAESGNGWQRPGRDSGQLLYLSRRARMCLRLPSARLDDAMQLSGQVLHVGEFELTVGAASSRDLSSITTLFARYLVCPARCREEDQFLHWARDALATLGVRARKMLAGRSHHLRLHDGDVLTRSLMLAGLAAADALRVQQHGLGEGRLFGCGLFLPHKGIEAVASARVPDK